MRVSLQIDGDSSGAVKAAEDTSAAVSDLGKQTEAISHAIEDGFKNAISSIDKFKQNAQNAGAANDNGAGSAAKFAERINQVAQAAAGADSALAKGTAGAINFAKGVGELFKTAGTVAVLGGALGLAVTTAQTFLSVINTGGADANRRLEEQARLIGVVKEGFSGAAEKADEFYRKNRDIVTLQASQALIAAQADLKKQSSSLSAGASGQPVFIEPFGGEASIGFDAAKINPFQEAIDNLFASIQRGQPDLDTYRATVAAIGNAAAASAPEVAAQANELLRASESAAKVADEVAKYKAILAVANGTATDAQKGLLGISTAAAATGNQFDRLSNAMLRQAAGQEAEANAAGKSVGEAAKLRAEFTLQEAARQAGIASTAELAAQIDKIANRYGEAAQKAALARLQSDAFFDRAQLGRNADDATLASQLRLAFGDTADLNSGIAATIRANNEMKELKSTAMDLGSGALTDLRQQIDTLGFSWQAAGNVGLHVIDRWLQKLATKQLDALISNIFGAFGIGGGVPGLNANGSIAGAVGPTSVGGAPLVSFDAGGWTGSGGKYQVAGVVHSEEFVFDQDATRRIGVDNLERMRRGMPGYAGGGLVGGPTSWGGSSPQAAPAAPMKLLLDLGVRMDDDGKMQAYVKRASMAAANQAVTDFAGSESFIQHTAMAQQAVRSRVLG